MEMKTMYHELTEAQKRIWYTQIIHSDSALYCIGGQLMLEGITKEDYIIAAIQDLVAHSDSFHMQFCIVNGEPRYYYNENKEAIIETLDFTDKENEMDEAEMWIQEQMKKSIPMKNNLLYQIALIRYGDKKYGVFVRMHHLISDGWSFKKINNTLSMLIDKFMKGEKIEEKTVSYDYFVESEKKYLTSAKYQQDQIYWKKEMEHVEDALQSFQEYLDAERKTYYLSGSILEQVNAFCEEHELSLNIFLLSMCMICKSKWNRKKDIIIGVPVLGRTNRKEREIIGMCVSSLPMRMQVEKEDTIFDFMQRVKLKMYELFRHQKYPFNHLVKDLGLEHETLYSVCYNYYGTKMIGEVNGRRALTKEYFNGNQEYELQFIIRDWQRADGLQIDIDYQKAVYEEKQIEQIYHAIEVLIGKTLQNPNQLIKEMSLLSKEENYKLVEEYNSRERETYSLEDSVVKLIEEQAILHGDRIAVKDEEKTITYKQLVRKANGLAELLKKENNQSGTIVGLVMTHTIESVIGILGILKSGAAYLPIDISCPKERMLYMLENAKVNVVLTNIREFEIPNYQGKCIFLQSETISEKETELLEYPSEHDLAYIIYTSGSTGKPKAVMITHRNLSNYIQWGCKQYVDQDVEVFPLYSSFAFDLTVTSIFIPLVSGGRIHTFEDNGEEYVINRILKENECTVLKLTPSHMRLITNTFHNTALRKFIVGGEDLNVDVARQVTDNFEHNIIIYNEYGPTEATVGCMCYAYNKESDQNGSVPIGEPIANTAIYVLDEELNPMPVGCKGELYIAGEGVTKGYLNQEEMTNERFIKNPFRDGRMYRTGDEAKFISNTNILYLGRKDQQVKIRGHRIELGEIESNLKRCSMIEDATVDVKKINGMDILCGYYIAKQELDEEAIKKRLANDLFDYMVPTLFVKIESIPLTVNGKVDRKRLPVPEWKRNLDYDLDELNEIEHALIQTAEKVLHVEHIHPSDNFYHLGGDSIKAIQLSSELRQMQYKLDIKDILRYPDLYEMSQHIQEKYESISQESCTGVVRITPMFHWFVSQKFYRPNEYCQSTILTMPKQIPLKTYEKILWELIKHHDALRLNYSEEEHNIYFNEKSNEICPEIKEWNVEYEQVEEKKEDLIKSMDIIRKPLIQTCICRTPQHDIWCIAIHHIAIDGVSWRILLEDIDTAFTQIMHQEEVRFASKTVSYQQWASRFDESQVQMAFDIAQASEKCQKLEFELEENGTEFLFSKANNKFHTKPVDLMLSTFLYHLGKIISREQIYIVLEGHGREGELDITRTVGWFTELKIVQMKLGIEQFKDIVNEVRVKSQPGQVSIGMDEIIEDVPTVRFNFLGEFQETYENFSVQTDVNIDTELVYDMEIDIIKVENHLQIIIRSKNTLSAEVLKGVSENFEHNLLSLQEYCNDQEKPEIMPADFDLVNIEQDEFNMLFE